MSNHENISSVPTGSMSFVLGMCLALFLVGCGAGKEEGGLPAIVIDWREVVASKMDNPSLAEENAERALGPNIRFNGITEKVGSEEYFGFRIDRREGDRVTGELIKVLVRRGQVGKRDLEILISCRVRFELKIRCFEGGRLESADGGSQFTQPFLFSPGQYRLKATGG